MSIVLSSYMCSINITIINPPWFSYFVASGSSGGSFINNTGLLNNNDIAVTWVLSLGIAGIGRNGGVEFEKERNQDGHYRSVQREGMRVGGIAQRRDCACGQVFDVPATGTFADGFT